MDTNLYVLGCSCLGAIVGAAISAWVQGRWTEAGRLSAIKAAFSEVLDQSRAKAKAEEEGRRLATHEDIDNVLREVRLTTKETEQIRSDIQSGVWERQNTWNLKRDMYIRLLDALGTTFSACNEASALYQRCTGEEGAIPPHIVQRAQEAGSFIRENHREISKIVAVSGLVISAGALGAVSDAFSKFASPGGLNSSAAFDQLGQNVDIALWRVQEIARDDLGIERFCAPRGVQS